MASGGGLAAYYTTINIYGGEITDNTAEKVGGGVLVNSNGLLLLHGGGINNNKADDAGGGIMLSFDSECTLSGGTVNGNEAVSGGGIYATGEGNTLTIDGVEITNNKAQNGGGVYAQNGYTLAALNVVSGLIANNRASANGGGIYIEHADLGILTVSPAAVFRGNSASGAYYRNPSDDALYAANIHSNHWTHPLSQGYNNYDIAYIGAKQVPWYVLVNWPKLITTLLLSHPEVLMVIACLVGGHGAGDECERNN